jgi:hypothetical protein
MSKIPTAEEFFKSSIPKYESVSELMTDGDIFYHAKEFAKLHVEAALKAAAENAETKEEASYGVDEIYYTRVVDKDSILNAYSLTNIK